MQEFFYDLRNDLAEEAGSNSNIQQAVDNFTELQDDIDYAIEQCSFPPDLIECPIALAELGFETLGALLSATQDLLEAGIEAIVDAYLAAWVEDIDDGLQHWSNIGNAFTTGLFDPAPAVPIKTRPAGRRVRASSRRPASPARTVWDSSVRSSTSLASRSPRPSQPPVHARLPGFRAAGIELVDEVFDAIDALIDVPLPLEKARRVQAIPPGPAARRHQRGPRVRRRAVRADPQQPIGVAGRSRNTGATAAPARRVQ